MRTAGLKLIRAVIEGAAGIVGQAQGADGPPGLVGARCIFRRSALGVVLMQQFRFLGVANCVLLLAALGFAPFALAQENSNWSSSSQRQDPNGNLNPLRTRESHSESNGRSIDRQTTETLGPDGQYVPYLDTETESVRVDANTVRTVRRTFGRSADGSRTMVQQTQEETHTLPGGEKTVTRTTSNPDANGSLQVVQREVQHARQISADVQEIQTTVLMPDINGGLAPSMQIQERERKNADGTIEFKKSTSLPDGAGKWQVGEVREGTRKEENGQEVGRDERVLRPDSSGDLTTMERTVTRQRETAPGETRKTTETFSTNVPGVGGNNGLQLVQRDTTVQRTNSAGDKTTTHQVEQSTPGALTDGLRVTGQTVGMVRSGAGGVATQQRTVSTTDANGNTNQVWVDVGKTDNPAVVHVDTKAPAKPK